MRNVILFIFGAILAMLASSCIKEERYLADVNARLVFSEDTVAFDTVFTTMGTTTQQVKVYNKYDETLLIDAVTLRGGAASRFRINVDGDTSFVARNVEIAANDSIFIFVEANIDPNDQLNPFLVEDAIVFYFNNHQQELPVTAYGRNAVYHLPNATVYSTYTNSSGQPDTIWFPYSIIDCTNWDHTRPHVIFGYAVVNSNETLHLQGGDKLFFGTDSYLWVYDSATLDVRGDMNNPVLFTSLRHDGWYDTLPGQWGYVWLSSGSKDNYIEWARIENGMAGLLVDTNVNGNPTLEIHNSVIENHSLAGIVGQGAYIVGDNLLVDNCGSTLLSLQYGGRYRFSNSTFANYWRYSSRKAPSVVLNNHYDYDGSTVFPRDLAEATFHNCIIYGNYSGQETGGELLLDRSDAAAFNYSFSHCILKTKLIDSISQPEARLIINCDPLFVDARGCNYHLLEESPARGAGDPSALQSMTDLDGVQRSTPPCIGAYEWVPSETSKKKSLKQTICTTTSLDVSTKPHRPTRSSTRGALATSSKSHSTPIVKSRIKKR